MGIILTFLKMFSLEEMWLATKILDKGHWGKQTLAPSIQHCLGKQKPSNANMISLPVRRWSPGDVKYFKHFYCCRIPFLAFDLLIFWHLAQHVHWVKKGVSSWLLCDMLGNFISNYKSAFQFYVMALWVLDTSWIQLHFRNRGDLRD